MVPRTRTVAGSCAKLAEAANNKAEATTAKQRRVMKSMVVDP
jgi:hypothetical protein